MSRNGKVVVAMSGGVDSSVAACLLKEQGYDCVGVFMRVGVETPENVENCDLDNSHNPRRFKHGCCSAADAIDARAIAGKLGIPFYALNFRDDFEHIIDYFVDEYTRARTPNPCVMCNIHLKFGKLLDYAHMLDAQYVATGHYARIVEQNSQPALARARNRDKDQSYVLFGIERANLGRCLFPLGEITDKRDVRRIAKNLDLRVHDKPDSQEICFVPDNDYKRLIRQRRPHSQQPGTVVDQTGKQLGTHEGVVNYTIGQRRGLGIAAGKPIYVTRLDVINNRVEVGHKNDLLAHGLIAEQINWLCDPPPGETPCEIKIRHMHNPAPGSIRYADDAVIARFKLPQTAVTPGQAAVFYDPTDVIIGGGWIREAVREQPERATPPSFPQQTPRAESAE